jgi:hypothetical protein
MTTRVIILEALAETWMQIDGMQFSVQLQCDMDLSPSDNLAGSQTFDMLAKVLGFDSQSA